MIRVYFSLQIIHVFQVKEEETKEKVFTSETFKRIIYNYFFTKVNRVGMLFYLIVPWENYVKLTLSYKYFTIEINFFQGGITGDVGR